MRHLLGALRGDLRRRARIQTSIASSWSCTLISRYYSAEAAPAATEETAETPVASTEKLDVLYAVPRDQSGSRASMKLRRVGRIPGIVFSQEDGHLGGHKQLVTLDSNQLTALLRRYGHSFFMSRLYMVEIRTDPDRKQGEMISRERVLPRLLHTHAVTDKVLNLTLIRAPPHARLRVDIPLVFIGQDVCPGIKKGGYLNIIRRTVSFYGAPDLIPKFIEVDLSNLQVGQSVPIKTLDVPKGLVVYAMDPSWPVCKVTGTRGSRAPPGKEG